MSSKIPTMSAGRAGSSKYNVNVNGNQGGGSKKGGLAPTTNKRVSYVLRAIQKRAYSSPDQRKMIYCVNQLGGIGAPTKMFATGADGSCASCSKEATANNFVILAYRQLLGRGVDNSGLRKYTKQILNDQRGLCIGMKQVETDLIASPEGGKYMNNLGSVEAQKHRDVVNEYIKKACTVVPVLKNKLLESEQWDLYDYLCSSNIIPNSEQNIPHDESVLPGWGIINKPGAKVSVINDYLIKRRDSHGDNEANYIKGKFMGDGVEEGCIKLYAKERMYVGLIYDFSGVENIANLDSSTELGTPAAIKLGSKEKGEDISIGTSGAGPITIDDLDENYKYCKINLITDVTYGCRDIYKPEFNEDGELCGCELAYFNLPGDENKNNSATFLAKYENDAIKIETIDFMATSDYTLPRSICMQVPTKKR